MGDPKTPQNLTAESSWAIDQWESNSLPAHRVLPVLDAKVLCSLRELDDGFASLVNDLGQLFLASAPQFLFKMRQAYSEGNLKLTKRIVHQLRSSSGNLGALVLAELCGQLEEYKGSPECADGADLIRAIEAEYDLVQKALREEMGAKI